MPNSILSGEWYSQALGRPTRISALLPPALTDRQAPKKDDYKTVYLLPGALSSSDAIFTETDLASPYDGIAAEGVIIIAVTPTFSFYCDYKNDYKYAHQYYTYIVKELVDMTRTLFPISQKPEDTAIYGCSMGGFGAWLCGLNNPELFGYIGAQSGMLDMQWAIDHRPFMTVKHRRQYGDLKDITGTMYDLYDLTKKLNARAWAGEAVPKLFQSWGGEEDYLNIPNIHMNEHMKTMKHLDYTCCKLHCRHGWGEHNEGVNLFMDWFLSQKRRKGGAE